MPVPLSWEWLILCSSLPRRIVTVRKCGLMERLHSLPLGLLRCSFSLGENVMIEREYRIRRLSDRSGYIVIIMVGFLDTKTLPRVYSKQTEARAAAKTQAKENEVKPIIIAE